MTYQLFSFENQSPERQREILEKQIKQQQQREILEQQIQARKREKELEREKEERIQSMYEQRHSQPQQQQQQSQKQQQYIPQPHQQQFQQTQNYPSIVDSPPRQQATIDFTKTNGGARNQPLVFTPQKSLLSDTRPRVVIPERQILSMSLTPSTIHDAFASLRHQIMTTAASTVISGSPDCRTRGRKAHATF
ncbi:hypothetical protein TRFO_15196 [Tritrichomonas foetus]|uniref:Uncharacterized protein n=1 Tax=Tritrichomonas foetus TaxID=1144522 RepID=A0A1J4KTF7_9EUKA|nr:hypothetical protein TRFO_15196 [Tritrichomonas foetus]|eukprot:OHT14418.1 hypothetical protein TRFO_15196 [Tritrichomonas foetus]